MALNPACALSYDHADRRETHFALPLKGSQRDNPLQDWRIWFENAMREQLETLAGAGKIGRKHVDPLLKLLECGYCQHRSWGFGRIKQLDPIFGKLYIDFDQKPSHTMDLGFAAEVLSPIPRDHILVRKAENLEELREWAESDPVRLIQLAVESLGPRATAEEIQQLLVPDIVGEGRWKSWWPAVKKQLKADGRFQIPARKAEPILFNPEASSLDDQLLQRLQSAKGLKAKRKVCVEMLEQFDSLQAPELTVEEAVRTLLEEIPAYQRTRPALALEAVLRTQEMEARLQREANAAAREIEREIWENSSDPSAVLAGLSASLYRRALESLAASLPDRYLDLLFKSLNRFNERLCRETIRFLVDRGHEAAFREALSRKVFQQEASASLLLWLAKEYAKDYFLEIPGDQILRAILRAIETESGEGGRSVPLAEYLVRQPKLLIKMVAASDLETIKDIAARISFTRGFDDVDRRSILATLVKAFPAARITSSAETETREGALVVSWESLHRKREEYRRLVEKELPACSREIGVARSHGDLRENHEYKAAKEHFESLLKKKTQIERELTLAQGTDFSDAPADRVGIGVTARLRDLDTGEVQTLSILGAWDFDEARHIISYRSPLAKALMGKKVGEEAELELEGRRSRYIVEAVRPYREATAAGTGESSSEPSEAPSSSLS